MCYGWSFLAFIIVNYLFYLTVLKRQYRTEVTQ